MPALVSQAVEYVSHRMRRYGDTKAEKVVSVGGTLLQGGLQPGHHHIPLSCPGSDTCECPKTPRVRQPLAGLLSTCSAPMFCLSASLPSPPQHTSYPRQQPPLLSRYPLCSLALSPVVATSLQNTEGLNLLGSTTSEVGARTAGLPQGKTEN